SIAGEARLGRNAIGTTGFGIGPAYEDKVARSGLRFADLVDFRSFTVKLERNLADKNAYLKAVLKAKPIKADELVAQMKTVRKRLVPLMADTASFLCSAQQAGQRILFEGAHGAMLDIDYGTYPYVTSSNCIASAAYAGAGLPPGKLDAVL